ncbi:hypothetical protein DFH08DRAFT_1071905 [Mycena albidolilacea]|uniref:F-box domain-containing protein n=1 Tax=Mycena albidolilacea TaxID=1033008 RepID=A0AAD7AQV2_9AGAR|nr:hypothetical protein DFH08DRAFT_1071905 [Mycena albidolilacea]
MADTSFTVRVRAAVIEQTERTRSSFKADIERLVEESESKIASLESLELREREHACVAALRYLISPIRTLPVELLSEIFGLAIHDDTHIKDAFRVSQVCSDWRRVAHCTPELWNRNFHVDLSKIDSDEFYADGLKDWLARSAPLPVPITWIAPRWRSLHFQWISPRWLISRLSECQLESLEALALTIPADFDPSAVLAFTVPRLRNCVSPTRYRLDLLAQCPNLVRASVFTGSVLPGAARDVLSLSHLRRLSIYYIVPAGHAAGYGAAFLDSLSAPVLEELCLGFGSVDPRFPRWTEVHFPAFQLRVPNITALELKYSMITSDELKDALPHAPCLTRLELRCCQRCLDDALLGTLHYKEGLTPLLADIMALTDIMASMIASRWWTDAKLASNRVPPAVARWTLVRLDGHFEPHFVDIIAGLQREGIPLEVGK